MNNGKQDFALGVDDAQAQYWMGVVTRKEIQPVFDQYGQVLTAQGQALVKLDICLGFVMEKLGLKPEDVTAWAEAKAKQAEAPQIAMEEKQ